MFLLNSFLPSLFLRKDVPLDIAWPEMDPVKRDINPPETLLSKIIGTVLLLIF